VERLLLPINLAKCSEESVALANQLTNKFGAKVALLYVFEEEATEAQKHRANHCLNRLGHRQLRSEIEWVCLVRMGSVTQAILTEAAALRAEMILLPTFRPPWWKIAFGVHYGSTTLKLTAQAGQQLVVVEPGTHFDCFSEWD
jgi:K+-sensing histidine kinase KdpD